MVNSTSVTQVATVPIEVEFYWESAIKATEDEPGCCSYVEILKAHLIGKAFFRDESGKVFLVLEHNCNLLDLLTQESYNKLVDMIFDRGKIA